jgi:hypothetical protein
MIDGWGMLILTFLLGTLVAIPIFFIGLLFYAPLVLVIEFYANVWWQWHIPEIIFWPPYFLLSWYLGIKKVHTFFMHC